MVKSQKTRALLEFTILGQNNWTKSTKTIAKQKHKWYNTNS